MNPKDSRGDVMRYDGIRYIVFFFQQNACQSNPCLNDAKCQAGFTSKGYRCLCPQGIQGDHCESGIDPARDDLNKNLLFL